jgi:polyphosphate kinase 2 (PPK2 family)
VRHLVEQIEALVADAAEAPRCEPQPMAAPEPMPLTIFDRLDMSVRAPEDHKAELLRWRARLNRTYRRAKKRGLATVLVFEGMDAAGKGGAIRRVAASLDARDYRIIPIAAPTAEERAQHYLWRFWVAFPSHAKMTFFDRSWYGRLLVERVEGFAKEGEWRRAFTEINALEHELVEDGVVLVKFWLHVSADEQLRRFKERENTPYKRFKITDEDWRNREKLPQYLLAAHEMIERTSCERAPWTIVESDDKAYARIKVVRTVAERLADAL